MYPNQCDSSTRSSAERRLYDAFRERLDDSYIVFHHVAWLSLDRRKQPRDGEADFVLVHPKRGILILEVKGGGIRRIPQANTWITIDAQGYEEVIRNPVEQAKDSKFTLLTQLRTMLSRYITIGHAVAFPDIIVTATHLGTDLPREIILDATNMVDIATWVEQTFAYWSGTALTEEGQPGTEGVQALISLLGKQWELRPALWGQFVAEDEQFVRLTEEQYSVLDGLNRHRRMVISGFAGSGKTMIAVEKAMRLARQGFRVLLVCYNRFLARDLQQRLQKQERLSIHTFHELCATLVEQAGIRFQEEVMRAVNWYDQILPNALLEALDHLEMRFDAIIVDEGQDFLEGWWTPLQLLLQDPDQDVLYILYDDNQCIYGHPSTLPLHDPPYLLTVNCRTTKHIHEQILHFYQGTSTPIARGPDGVPVEFQIYESKDHLQVELMTLLQKLTTEDRIPPEAILVLTPYSRKKSWIKAEQLVGTVGLDWNPGPGQVRLATIHAFKGLERSVVILVELERWLTQGVQGIDLKRLLYVGSSRAKNYLLVLLPKKHAEEMLHYFQPTQPDGIGASDIEE
jgi:hypothetical protein